MKTWHTKNHCSWGNSILWDTFYKSITGAKTGLSVGDHVLFRMKYEQPNKPMTRIISAFEIKNIRYSENVHDLFWADVDFVGARNYDAKIDGEIN